MDREAQAYAFTSVMVAIGIVVAIRLVLGAVARVRTGSLATLRGDDSRIIDVSSSARGLRWRGRFLLFVVYYLVAASVATTAAAPSVWGLVFTILMFVVLVLVLRVGRVVRHPSLLRRLFTVTTSRIGAIVIYVLAGCFLVFGLAMSIAGVRIVQRNNAALDTALSEAARREHQGLIGIGLIMMVVPIALTAIVPMLLRLGRRLSRLHAADVRRRDLRPPVLFLRAFGDDKLKVEALASSRRPLVELIWPTVRDRFEAVIAWSADVVGPPVSIARPGTRLASLGAAREYVPDDGAWLDYVTDEIGSAAAVVASIGQSDGLLMEMRAISSARAVERTVFVFPPVAPDERRVRWQLVAVNLGLDKDAMPLFDPAGALIAAVVDGSLHVVTSDRADEASYRAALTTGLELVSRSSGSSTPSPPNGPSWPSPPPPLPASTPLPAPHSPSPPSPLRDRSQRHETEDEP